MRLALAQLNPTVGALSRNAEKVADAMDRARATGAQLLLTPELVLAGYPPEDLLLREDFVEDCMAQLRELAHHSGELVSLVGLPYATECGIFNALAVLQHGRVQAVYHKRHLPNYGVFDEKRVFDAGEGPATIRLDGELAGLTICEDIWLPGEPATDETRAGANLLLNISASPYYRGKGRVRQEMLATRARDNLCAIAYCNLVGGQDELVFDGQSLVVDHRGEIVARGAQFEEDFIMCDLQGARARAARRHDARHRGLQAPDVPVLEALALAPVDPAQPAPERHDVAPMDDLEEVYSALVLGAGDYVRKSGFDEVLLGLSGGIDSALVALIARDALGPERVHAVVMPSQYSSEGTQADARQLAADLELDCRDIPIADLFGGFADALAPSFADRGEDVTEENLQARIRGALLMALSNKFNWMLLSTGNKSEMSVGYSTLYGDLNGGFNPLKDVPKTTVFALTRWRNARDGRPLASLASIIERPPSAELRDGQRDDQSLPPYEILDPILRAYVEEDLGLDDIVEQGFERETVARVIRLVNTAEYKRRQAPPGVKITARAFGRDRRMPIINHYRHRV